MQRYDLVIAGAGIHGAGIAQAAAARNWKVLVVEKRKEAGLETSSNSSKLIHGGLRYLETGQFALVRECLRERQLLLRNAPELVRLQPFYLPVYAGSSRPAWKIGIGLKIYDFFSGRQAPHSFRVPEDKWSELPIKQQGLQAVYGYYDGQTDDRALTQAVLRSALSLGAETRFAAGIDQVKQAPGGLVVHLSDAATVHTRALVNAAGAWANTVAVATEGAPVVDIDWVQGVHLLLDVPAFSGCFYLEAADSRAVFVLPWEGKTLVGTTEQVLAGPTAVVSELEVGYLLDTFNQMFPDHQSDRKSIVKTFAGVRVLPKVADAANRRSRETILVEEQLGQAAYLAVYGGKLTSYRATAEKVAQKLAKVLGGQAPAQNTAAIRLTL